MKGFAVNHIIFFFISRYFGFSRIKYHLTVNKDVKIKLLNYEKFDLFFTDCMQFNENILIFVISIND
jgi:hypothetical protein